MGAKTPIKAGSQFREIEWVFEHQMVSFGSSHPHIVNMNDTNSNLSFEAACLALGVDPHTLPFTDAMTPEHPRSRTAEAETAHDMTDAEWTPIQSVIPADWGSDRRVAINAALFVVATGKPWTVLPERFGSWDAQRRRFSRWAHAGHWGRIADAVEASTEIADARKLLFRKVANKAKRQCELLPEYRARVTGFRA